MADKVFYKRVPFEDVEKRIEEFAEEISWKITSALATYKIELYDSGVSNLIRAGSMLINCALIKMAGVEVEAHRSRSAAIKKYLDPKLSERYESLIRKKAKFEYAAGRLAEKQEFESKLEAIQKLLQDLKGFLKQKNKCDGNWNLNYNLENLTYELEVDGIRPPCSHKILAKLRKLSLD